MIKCLFLVHRAPHLNFEQFADYWSRVHARLAVTTAPVLRMRRYVQNHYRDHPIAEAFRTSRNCLQGQFDGVAEAWWDSFEDMAAAAGETPEEVAAALLQDEAQFVDLRRSVIWFGEEKTFWPVASAHGDAL